MNVMALDRHGVTIQVMASVVGLILSHVGAVGAAGDEAPVSQQPNGYQCTLVIGFSQAGLPQDGWFVQDGAFLAEVGEDHWQLLWAGGAGVDRWRDPDYAGWQRPLVSPCPQHADRPDRVVLSISGPYGDQVDRWSEAIGDTIRVIHEKYPSARQIVLQPVVGGPGGQPCPFPAARENDRQQAGEARLVRASWQQPHIIKAIEQVLADTQRHPTGVSVVAGMYPFVRQCDDFQDALGHLTPEGAAAVGREIGRYYANLDHPGGEQHDARQHEPSEPSNP